MIISNVLYQHVSPSWSSSPSHPRLYALAYHAPNLFKFHSNSLLCHQPGPTNYHNRRDLWSYKSSLYSIVLRARNRIGFMADNSRYSRISILHRADACHFWPPESTKSCFVPEGAPATQPKRQTRWSLLFAKAQISPQSFCRYHHLDWLPQFSSHRQRRHAFQSGCLVFVIIVV